MQATRRAAVHGIARMALAVAVGGLAAAPISAQEPVTVLITVKNRRFVPAEVSAPANTALLLRVRNQDATPMEFESVTLRVEKVVAGNSEGIIRMRPLAPGRYKFFDDFNQGTGQGVLVVK